jgi:1-acyl-sn-glycerol-3-phosphate acyltransferase
MKYRYHHLLNLLFAIIAILFTTALSYLGLTVRWAFMILAVANVFVTIYIYRVIPEFFFRFLCFVLSRIIYRVTINGQTHLPEKGPAVLVCNHVTFVDWMIIAGACPRPVRFVMDQAFLNIPFTGRIFRDGKVIPITTGKKGPKLLKAAFEKIAHELESGNIVCIFPEGQITRTGRLNPFRPGIERIINTTPVPVIPMALNGLWGSFFSRKYGRAMSKPFRRFRSRITLEIGPAIAPEQVTASGLQTEVDALYKVGSVNTSS